MSSKLIERFHNIDPTDAHIWRAINLFGKNVASYKFALAKSTLELAKKKITNIKPKDLAEPFSRFTCEHIKKIPKQSSSPSSKFLDACKNFNSEKIEKDELLSATEKYGFNYVLDHFHIVNGKSVNTKFFNDDRKGSKSIILTDEILKLASEENGDNLFLETEARWRLVETSWSLGVSRNLINVDIAGDLLFVGGIRRTDVTSARDALNGYQKSKCFYCYQDISVFKQSTNLCDVDHFFPHELNRKNILSNLDGVWNLVLSCQTCNRGISGKFARLPSLKLLERLNKRNEYYISSHDPLRETIMAQSGNNYSSRKDFLQNQFKTAKIHAIHEWEPEPKGKEIF